MGVPLAIPAAAAAGPPGWLLTAGLTAASFFGKLFGSKSAENEQKRRYAEFIQQNEAARRRTITEGTRLISQKTRGQIARNRGATARRMQALGFASEAESFIQPSEQILASQGNQSLKDFLFDTNRYFDQTASQANLGFQGRSIKPGVGDYIGELAPAAQSYFENEKFLDAIKGMGEHGGSTSDIPSMTVKSEPAARDNITDMTTPPNNQDRIGDSSWAQNFTKMSLVPRDITGFSRLSNLPKASEIFKPSDIYKGVR